MASISNVNSNSAVINVGRTTPVSPGSQTADKSIPVVLASDQTAVPVVEQNKVQSEVALSLLGIPRAEVALGIFADVNTYDVNPSEWSMKPAYYISGDGIKHLPTEAGALVEASRNKIAVLTSKRFFRYQPGRVSAATFGIKSSVSVTDFAQNPVIRKYGIYDKYDGYYWETRNNGQEDNFSVVRRTQSLQYSPVSTYGLAGITKRRGEDNLGTVADPADFTNATTIDNTQVDDYRIVGLGAPEGSEFEGSFVSDRKIITEKRYEFIDEVLSDLENYSGNISVSKGTTTSTITNINMDGATFYHDLALAYNASIGKPGFLNAAQMEAKCKRDLDYWIDVFLEDLKWGGNGHTKWNTTNFALSDGTSNWSAKKVGVFPNISKFERVIHERISHHFQSSFGATYADNNNHAAVEIFTGLSAAAKTKLDSLQDIVLAAFVDSGSSAPTEFAPQTTGITYGSKSPLDTFYETKRNFWSYYVTTKKEEVGISQVVANKTYTILDKGENVTTLAQFDAMSDDTFSNLTNDVYEGRVFTTTSSPTIPSGVGGEAQVMELIEYEVPAQGTSSANSTSSLILFKGLPVADAQQFIKDKCQRDVGYVIDGYKNDVATGSDAETTYNMQMFTRGTGMSVYSQRDADGTLTEPERHNHLKDILAKDLPTSGLFSASQISNQAGLAQRVEDNFTNEDLKTMTIVRNNRAFPGNLVVLRDGLIHTHGAVYDPSLLKDDKKVKTIVTAGTKGANLDTKVASVFKLTEGSVTFGQHVKLEWTGAADSIVIQAAPATSVSIFKGEVLRVRRVLGPKGNEFTLVKADGTSYDPTNDDKPLMVTLDASNLTAMGTVYVNTVVPFAFPKDYDLDEIQSDTASYTSEIMTTYATTKNYANDRTGAAAGDNPAKQRAFKGFASSTDTMTVPRGAMFPYQYAFKDDLLDANLSIESGEDNSLGFINTALNTDQADGVDRTRSQIDNVNFYPEYVNWIKNNVKPEYWGVYEYRVPRSRFSHDTLNGIKDTADTITSTNRKGSRFRVYSDLATGTSGKARPGQIYTNSEGTQSLQNSLYDFDFTKVTMLKIEFSWYGAVGALFLAYIPVDNGEARWVRVHHLRASNQLKIASLGNATLPITYTTYGGGSLYCLGDGEDTLNQQGYGNSSHHIVKYGASYYIDGGDRGTVRLYSHNNQDTVSARGKRFTVANANTNYQENSNAIPGESVNTPTLAVTERYVDGDLAGSVSQVSTTGVFTGTGFTVSAGDVVRVTDSGSSFTSNATDYTVAASPTPSATTFKLTNLTASGTVSSFTNITFQIVKVIDPTFYMGAQVKTNSLLDQNVQVIWADSANNRVHLSSPLNSTSGVSLLPDRSATVYGVETKKSIKSTRESNVVRNRVQVYPTKLSSANIGNDTVRLRFKKTPTFQTHVAPNGTFRLNGGYSIDNTNQPITQDGTADYLLNDTESFGWLRGRIVSEAVTVFGRLYREADAYYFELLQSFEGEIELIDNGVFLPDLKFQADGKNIPYTTTNTKYSEEKEGLSSVEIASNSVVPIAGTGINVATTYLRVGTEQFDLSPYFDYNKEYLSFPLTDIADSLYFAVDSDTVSTNTDEISLGVTWEEQ